MQREAYFAGQWYPADEGPCRQAIMGHAADAQPEQGGWRGLIGPHAGWYFSGDAAGRAHRWLSESRGSADLAVVFGAHGGPHTIFVDESWATPVGSLCVAQELARKIQTDLGLPAESVAPARPDNAAELHLPFVRHFFPRAELMMLGVAPSEDAGVLGRLVGEVCRAAGRDAVFVGSTDLTHYGPNYGFEPAGRGAAGVDWVRQQNDREVIDAILANDLSRVLAHSREHHSACCPGAVVATLSAVAAFGGGAEPRLIDHYLSYDVQPGPSFVGYAGIVL